MIRRIDVTKKHIENSDRACPSACMLANAVKDATGLPLPYVDVQYTYINLFTSAGMSYKIPLPREMANNVWNWDRGREVEPFSFYIDIPDHLLQLVDLEHETEVAIATS